MPGVSSLFGAGLVAMAKADQASSGSASPETAVQVKPEADKPDLVKSDSVRVLPDNFLSGNSESGKTDAEKVKLSKQQSGKPQAGKSETGQTRSNPFFAKPEASTPEAGKTESGQAKNGDPSLSQARYRQGANADSSTVFADPVDNVQAADSSGLAAGAGWDLMPAGARPAYMGIHGGTMPVSLLVSNDGNSLLTFVGRTGNDFLDMLRRTDLPLPSLFNSTDGQLPRQVDFQAGLAGARVLSAGSGQARMPVLCLTADAFARLAPTPDMLQPFGLSDKPLALEGEVMPPDKTTPAKQFRMFFQPQYLQPGANRQ